MQETEQLSLSWDAHQKSICSGLSLLQQRGEFVDMTLAADGHYVKVHQMVLSLVSPYIKELISTAQCPNPIIFLNNISYTTLCAILEYIYTGEVLVPKDKLSDLIAAGKALHIRGLKEMDETQAADAKQATTTNASPPRQKSISEKLRAFREKKKAVQCKEEVEAPPQVPVCKVYLDESNDDDFTMNTEDSSTDIQNESTAARETTFDTTATHDNSNDGLEELNASHNLTPDDTRIRKLSSKTAYTVSNQGGLQAIHNRFIYQLRYIRKDKSRRSWRCINYNMTRCCASIITNEDGEVTDRKIQHNHPFHDKSILKKLRVGVIYSKFQDASSKIGKKEINE